jgi:Transcriptional regulators
MEDRTGLPLSWYEVLLSLHEAPGEQLRMHRLADSLLLSRSAVTRFIDRMEAAGLVARTGCPRDGRGVNVTLTVEGRHRFAAAAPIHLEGISRRFGAFLSREEAEVIARALRRVAAANQSSG